MPICWCVQPLLSSDYFSPFIYKYDVKQFKSPTLFQVRIRSQASHDEPRLQNVHDLEVVVNMLGELPPVCWSLFCQWQNHNSAEQNKVDVHKCIVSMRNV